MRPTVTFAASCLLLLFVATGLRADEPSPDREGIVMKVTDQDVRTALTIIAEQGRLNLILTPEVQGKVTMRLEGIDARAALDAVARTVGARVVEVAPGVLRIELAGDDHAKAQRADRLAAWTALREGLFAKRGKEDPTRTWPGRGMPPFGLDDDLPELSDSDGTIFSRDGTPIYIPRNGTHIGLTDELRELSDAGDAIFFRNGIPIGLADDLRDLVRSDAFLRGHAPHKNCFACHDAPVRELVLSYLAAKGDALGEVPQGQGGVTERFKEMAEKAKEAMTHAEEARDLALRLRAAAEQALSERVREQARRAVAKQIRFAPHVGEEQRKRIIDFATRKPGEQGPGTARATPQAPGRPEVAAAIEEIRQEVRALREEVRDMRRLLEAGARAR